MRSYPSAPLAHNPPAPPGPLVFSKPRARSFGVPRRSLGMDRTPRTGDSAPFPERVLSTEIREVLSPAPLEASELRRRARVCVSSEMKGREMRGLPGKFPGSSIYGCGVWAYRSDVDVPARIVATGRHAYVADRFHCGSKMCPVCSERDGSHMRLWLELQLFPYLRAHNLTGGLLTLTGPHNADEPSAFVVRRTRSAVSWFSMRMKRDFRSLDVQVGKALEATFGINGIHPHYHCLLTYPQSLSEDQLSSLHERMRVVWSECLDKFGVQGNRHALDFKPGALSDYIAKIQASYELASYDTKSGRAAGRTIVQLLADMDRFPELQSVYVDAVQALHGARRFDFQAMSKAYGLPSPTAWKLPEPEGPSEFSMVFHVANAAWSAMTNPYVFKDRSQSMLKYAARLVRQGVSPDVFNERLAAFMVSAIDESERFDRLTDAVRLRGPDAVFDAYRSAFDGPVPVWDVPLYLAARDLISCQPARANRAWHMLSVCLCPSALSGLLDRLLWFAQPRI